MQRRQALQSLGALMLGGPALLAAPTSGQRRPRILFFSRSVLFEHSVVRREGQSLSLAEKLFSEWAGRAGLDVECTKDGTVFDGDLDQYAAVVSYTCGRPADLMKPVGKDGSRPLSERGWKKLDAAVLAAKLIEPLQKVAEAAVPPPLAQRAKAALQQAHRTIQRKEP